MIFSFRLRRFLRRLAVTVLVLILAAAALLLCWLLWLNRYVIYTKDGARLDFGISLEYPDGEPAVAPSVSPSLPVTYGEETEPTAPPTGELTRLQGYYVDLETLQADPAALRAKLEQLPAGTPVMLEVKSIRGEMYYSSGVAKNTDEVDTAQVDSLIAWLKDRHYLIARMPAFRDYWYGLNNVEYGLPKKWAGGALWMDEQWCYWLNPASEGAISYLVRIVTELRTLGFDEVVFSDFRFPDTDMIDFAGDRLSTLNQAAADLVSTCATDTFAVSFQRSDTLLQLPEGRTRLYLTDVAAADTAVTAEQALVADAQTQVVFLADSNDTRYEEFGFLRPLDSMR